MKRVLQFNASIHLYIYASLKFLKESVMNVFMRIAISDKSGLVDSKVMYTVHGKCMKN